MIWTVAMDVMVSFSTAVQDTSVPFRSFIGSGAVSVDISGVDP